MKFFDYLSYLAIRAAYGFFAMLPESWVYAFARGLGRLAYLVDRKHRRIAESNIRQALGREADETRVRALAKAAYLHFGLITMEGPLLQKWMRSGEWQTRFEIPEAAKIRELIQQGRGVLLLPPHFGNWEVLNVGLGLAGFPFTFISRPLKNPYLVEYFRKMREASGCRLVPRRGGFRDLLPVFREGGLVALMPDQNQRKRPMFAPWFGRLAATDRSPAFCALRLGAPALAIAAIRQGNRFHFRVEMEVVQPPPPSGDRDLDEHRFTEAVHRTIERMVLRHPEQYFWLHDRYRTRPPQEGGTPLAAAESAEGEES